MRPLQTHATSSRAALAALVALSYLVSPVDVRAQERTVDEIAADLANPNTSLGTLAFNFDYQSFGGDLPAAGDAKAFILSFQPSLPFPLGGGTNLFARPLVPLIFRKDVPAGGGLDRRGVAFGDIGFDVGIGRTFKGKLVAVGGMVGTLPTAGDGLGLDQWLLGPEGLVAVVGRWGALGALITHQWDVAGESSFSTSITGGQYFIVYGIGGGWQIRSAPVFTYNHEAAEGQRLTMPLGLGLSRTAILGKTPWKFGAEYWYYVAKPDAFGPSWQIRVSVAPVVPLPW